MSASIDSAQASFVSAQFGDSASFDSAQFGGKASFNDLELKGVANWQTAEFKDFVTFENANWDVDGKNLHHGRAFGATRFRDVADFESKHPFHAFAAFDGASFERTLLLKDPSTGGAPKARFKDACLAVKAAIVADIASANADEDDKRSRRQVAKEAKANRWDELAGGYRTAKAAMERQGAFERAQRYYRCLLYTSPSPRDRG